jgi:hypothetical protein
MPTIATQTVAIAPETLSTYASLASEMDKYESIAIFRRFGDLNLMNLLSLQAEVQQLRTDFKAACEQEHLPIIYPPTTHEEREETEGNLAQRG